MAFDGLAINAVKNQIEKELINGRITKIYQPEQDEIILIVKNNANTYRLLLSANASLPLVYISTENKENPMTAPNFCMLLRKHINNGKIISIQQPSMERILNIYIEHMNEMGDICQKILIIELMGKHSNIIFCDDKGMIIDSIKRVSAQVSSVREVLPARQYELPPSQNKLNPIAVDYEQFSEAVFTKDIPIYKAIYTAITGISPLIANEIAYRAGIDQDAIATTLSEEHRLHLYKNFERLMEDTRDNNFECVIVYDGEKPLEFATTLITCYPNYLIEHYDTISQVLEKFYAKKNSVTRIKQRSTTLRKIVQNAIDRAAKKYDLQHQQLEDTKNREKYKVYGELINTYGYELKEGAKELTCLNYYTEEELTIPLDATKSAKENAKLYFDRYNKKKRTYEALIDLIEDTKETLEHLETIMVSLEIAAGESDLDQIRKELSEYGYMKKHVANAKNKRVISQPLHFISDDGFHIYVGKNNYQNEELTFKFATGNDWWFHTKGMAGSHVIVKADNKELSDKTFEQAAALAAYYSKAGKNEKVDVDYTQKKNVKKPPSQKPGFVIYNTNFSMTVVPSNNLEQITAR